MSDMYQHFSSDDLELITDRSPALTKELLGQYLSEEAALLYQALALYEAQDWPELSRVFHKYRASYQMIGLGSLAKIMVAGEAACQQGTQVSIGQAIESWQQISTPLRQEVQAYLAKMGL